MSGAVAAHAAYNGSGTQGLAVTNKIRDNDGDVMSVFWNKNDTTRQLLYGSSLIEIPSSGASTLGYNSSRLFTVNNDIDCLGDIYLQIGETGNFLLQLDNSYANVNVKTNNDGINLLNPIYGGVSIFPLVSRIEVQVGTQIWQTLENQDLEVLLASEVPLGCYKQTIDQATISTTTDNTLFLRIPCLTKTLGPQLSKFSQQTEDGYPMAAAPHQSVKFKVYFAEETSLIPKTATIIQLTAESALDGADTINSGDHSSLPVYILLASNSGSMILYKGNITVTNNTGNPEKVEDLLKTFSDNLPGGPISEMVQGDNSTPVLVTTQEASISSCKMYAKQQIMCNEEREQMKAMPLGLPKRLKMTQNAFLGSISQTSVTMDLDHFSLYASHLLIASNTDIQTAELKLNSSSFSGALPGMLLYSATSESLATYCNKQITNILDVGMNDNGTYTIYTFPLAATAYSGSSVPLNRFDSIRLNITFSGNAPGYGNSIVSVTCVGETTALFKDGAASLAMY